LTVTRPACTQLRASVRDPTPAFDSTRSSVFRGRFFGAAGGLTGIEIR
jgi:hypothetical protein